MKKLLFIALFGILFLVGCNNQKKSNDPSTEEATEQFQESDNDINEENEGAIDDSGETYQDSIYEIESE